MIIFEGFRQATVRVHEMDIFCRIGGQGDPVLLLHGFPQTHVMWSEIARSLAKKGRQPIRRQLAL